MKLKRLMVGLAVAGSIGYVGYAYAAGLWPTFPIVGSATYCAGASSSVTGTIIGLVTGCPNQVPAGPTILTGNEKIPADTGLASGINPQTVLITPASLNALPVTVLGVGGANPAGISASNTQGGIIYNSIGTITAANISLPPTPIDGQQYAVNANHTITTLSVAATSLTTQSVSNTPTSLTASVSVAQGYRFMWSAANATWFRLQ